MWNYRHYRNYISTYHLISIKFLIQNGNNDRIFLARLRRAIPLLFLERICICIINTKTESALAINTLKDLVCCDVPTSNSEWSQHFLQNIQDILFNFDNKGGRWGWIPCSLLAPRLVITNVLYSDLQICRNMNIDYELVGFYQSHMYGACFNQDIMESLVEYQINNPDAVVLIYGLQPFSKFI